MGGQTTLRDAKPSPKRHAKETGYAAGKDAQKRIIQAALRIFSESGYLGASTRRIAAEAEVNTPAIQYYFESKQGLHLACARVISESWRESLQAELEAGREVLAGRCRQKARQALDAFLDASLEHSLNYGPAGEQRRFFVRVQAEGESPALEVVRAAVIEPMLSITRGLIALYWDRPEDDAEVQLATFAVIRLLTAFGSAVRDENMPAAFSKVRTAPTPLVKRTFRRGIDAILALS